MLSVSIVMRRENRVPRVSKNGGWGPSLGMKRIDNECDLEMQLPEEERSKSEARKQ